MKVAIALALCVIAGCSPAKHVSDELNFRAPDGWKEMSSGGDSETELWHSANAKQPGILSLDRDDPVFDATIVVKTLVEKDGKLVAQRTMTLCGNQPSVYSRVVQKAHHGRRTYTWEIVTSRTPSALWEAQYMYSTDSIPDPQAQRALYDLCPAK